MARRAALDTLMEINSHGAYANIALSRVLSERELSDADRRFATELVYGTIKAGKTIDWMLERYMKKPLSKSKAPIRDILRLGMYQLKYMDKVPESAACNESVNLAKRYGKASAGFVNAVLRSAVREPDRTTFPDKDDDPVQYLALSSMHPSWLTKHWIKQFGYESAEKLCRFDNAPAILSLRTNTLRCSREELIDALEESGAHAELSRLVPEGVLVKSHTGLAGLTPLQDGRAQVQDESSMMVAHVLDPHPGEFVIDACSAPGGKTTHIAQMMNDSGRIAAFDIYEHKIKRIEENAARLGIHSIEAALLDARMIGTEYEGMADRVLLDVPCSGLGVLRRRPDARWRKTEESIAMLPALQREILDSGARAVKPGGILVYSTCTIEPAENERMVQSFLNDHPEYKLESAGALLPVPRNTDMVQLLPQIDGTDGFFIARMRRQR